METATVNTQPAKILTRNYDNHLFKETEPLCEKTF